MELLELTIALAQTWMGESEISHQKEKALFSFFKSFYLNNMIERLIGLDILN